MKYSDVFVVTPAAVAPAVVTFVLVDGHSCIQAL